MRENIIAFLNQGEKSYKSKSNAIRNFIGFQVIFPIPIALGLIMGGRFIRTCMICVAVVCILSIIAAIVCCRISKINNVFSYNFLVWTEMGINVLVFAMIFYYIRYNNLSLCTIVVCVSVIICVIHIFINRITIKNGSYTKKQRNMETVIISAGTVGAVIGRNIAACIMPKLPYSTVLEIVTVICTFLSVVFLTFGCDEFQKIYLLNKYQIDIYSEVGIEPDVKNIKKRGK